MELKNEKSFTTVITNGKGGAAKSTNAQQVAATFSLSKNREVTLYELDDENQDSASFTKTKIKTEQIKLGDYSGLTNQLRELFLGNKNDVVIDIGGNRTTTEFLKALNASRMYKKVDLFIIPITSGSQDVKNARDTFDAIKGFGVPIIFSLSRCRHEANSGRVRFQYKGFFDEFKKDIAPYYVLRDSDSIDLSRMFKKTVYELAHDEDTKIALETQLDEALDIDNEENIHNISLMLEILDDSENFYKENLVPAHNLINKYLGDK